MLSCAFCAIYEPVEVNTYMLLVLLCAIYSEQTNKNANHTLDSVQTRESLAKIFYFINCMQKVQGSSELKARQARKDVLSHCFLQCSHYYKHSPFSL